MKTALIHSDDWRRFDYGPEHPLRMERLGLTWRLMEAYGLTALAGSATHRPEPAPEASIARYHHPEYIEMLKACNNGLHPRAASMFGLGPGDNPVFRGVWDCARLVAGGSLLAADLIAKGEVDRVFHFAGGLHHAVDQRASGFCYVNDAVLAIMRLRERGLRVAYVDIDAHHGDGVQAAFYRDPNVLTISTHERGERLFPGTGFVREAGEGAGVGYSVISRSSRTRIRRFTCPRSRRSFLRSSPRSSRTSSSRSSAWTRTAPIRSRTSSSTSRASRRPCDGSPSSRRSSSRWAVVATTCRTSRAAGPRRGRSSTASSSRTIFPRRMPRMRAPPAST